MLYLASQSPRRAELLSQLQVPFQTLSSEVDESPLAAEDAYSYVKRLAIAKAQAGWQLCQGELPVLGSDTSVVFEQQILGKPTDKSDCHRMLSLLSGKTHQVMTAIALVHNQGIEAQVVTTQVSFKVLTDSEIDWYWQTGEPQDKAGSYGIQGLAGQFVTQIQGSYSAVVGLPLYETSELLKKIK